MRVLIVGCGYVGLELGRQLLAQQHQVWGVRRSADAAPALAAAGITPVTCDIAAAEQLSALPAEVDWVAHLVSSSRGGVDEYQRVYVQGTKNLLDWSAGRAIKKLVYTSSTSVYGQTDGASVKENSPTDPQSETGRILVTAEALIRSAVPAVPAVILRAGGIYGPGRGHLFLQYLRNEARIYGNGDHWLNMIHRDDLAGLVIAALKSGRPGEIYNAVDDEPVLEVHFFRWLSETLGKWMPPTAPAHERSGKRGITNKRVQNRRARMELGYTFKYPTFRQGYTEEIRRLDRAGELNIEPEPR